MTGNGAVLDFCGPFPDGDGICDLTTRVFEDASVLRAAYAALRPQVGNQLFFQHSPRLNEQATVNGLVRHAHTLVVGILVVSHPEICSGDQSNSSLLATISRSCSWVASRHRFGRKAESQAR